MANLIVTPARGGGYFVIDADRQVEVAFFQNQNIASDFAAQGVTTAAAIQIASTADVRVSGGPAIAPAPLPVSTSPTIGNNVTYSTPDPAESPFAADRAARQALVGQSVPVTVVNDPLYEGGTRPEIVTLSQTQTAPAAVSNPPNPQVPPTTSSADVGEVPTSSATRSPQPVSNDPQVNPGFVFNEDGELIPADSAAADRVLAEQAEPQIDPYTAVIGRDLTEEEIQEEDNPTIDDIRASQVIGFGSNGLDTFENQEAADRAAAQAELARRSAVLRDQRRIAEQGDWRVRLRLAPGANYLYRANDGQGVQSGILQPLADTDGVVFPYMPTISTSYVANYSSYDLTHSNFRGYFYQNSAVGEIQLTADFTAQDSVEARYLLAVIHFFRSVTKMFYGANDSLAGAPPPLVFLQGLGEYQFNLHPCVVKEFNYSLPNDVDYIRANSPNVNGTNLLQRRSRQSVTTNPFSGALARLSNAGLPPGGINQPPPPPTLGLNSPTYVPTKMQMTLVLLPIQTRQQVSQQFSLEKFANGSLVTKGFW